MGAPKGNKFSPGRPKGLQNKTTKAANELLDRVMDRLGGEKWLYQFAIDNPVEFAKLWGKKIRQEMEVSGPNGGPIQSIVKVEFIGTDKRDKG